MRDFTLHNPTRVLFGKGQIGNLGTEVPADARVVLVAGRGSIRDNGVLEQVKAALGSRLVGEVWDVEPNPDVASVLRGLEEVRSRNASFLLAAGGGSVVDATKAIAALARSDGDPWPTLTRGRFKDALPLGVVMTSPGTGSEANASAAISNRATKQKVVFTNAVCFPRFAVLDPETTFSLPPRQVSNWIVDAFVHVLEQYLTYPVGAALGDRLAEAVLSTLLEQGPLGIASPNDYLVRANLSWAASLALNGLLGAGVPQDWTTHHIGHELTALYGIDHARTLAVVLPAVLEHRRVQKTEKLLQYGARVFGIVDGSNEERVERAIARTVEFFEALGVPTRLGAYALGSEEVPQIVANLKASRRLRMGERLDITLDDAAKILTRAL
ncbi:MAG TPA: iron-containing alcohol dehydrogenase [Polyangiaceae bacterium]|nr:iron-containing alcohol dehydrogenase [Polyangiaceae bacterium]